MLTMYSWTPLVYERLLQRCADGYYAAVVASPPCSTFSVSRFFSTPNSPDEGPPPVRDRDHVLGLPEVPAHHARELVQANELLRRTAQLLRAANSAGAEFILEHAADRGALSSPLYLHKRHAPIWLMPDVQALRADCSATLISFPQCALGAPTQYTRRSKTSADWTSRVHAPYPPDFNFLSVAKVFGTLHTSSFHVPTAEMETAQPPPLPRPAATPSPPVTADIAPSSQPPLDGAQRKQSRTHFRRSIGEYLLRLRGPSAWLTFWSRKDKPIWGVRHWLRLQHLCRFQNA
eukprot:2779111-Pleurochrysis_carterae.AAC.1